MLIILSSIMGVEMYKAIFWITLSGVVVFPIPIPNPIIDYLRASEVDHIGGYMVSHIFALHYFEQIMSKRKV
jgi:hypothetical protein